MQTHKETETEVAHKEETATQAEKTPDEINREYAEKYLAESRKEFNPGFQDTDLKEAARRELAGEEISESKTELKIELTEEEEAKRKQEELEEEGRRIASQWTSDPDAASKSNSQVCQNHNYFLQ